MEMNPVNPGENEYYQNSVTHRDEEGFLRHNQCTYILSSGEQTAATNTCKACYCATETI